MTKQTGFKIIENGSYKIGVDEVEGLKAAMKQVLKPVLERLNDLDSWSGDNWFQLEEAEYRSRDGFMAYSSNLGGILIDTVIPKCGESDFSFLEFGEYTEQDADQTDEDYDSQRESEESEGHLDAKVRIWLKLESIEDGELSFYLVMSGSNSDAPYFREKYQPILFEASFSSKSVDGLKRAASKHVAALLKIVDPS